MWIFGYGSLMGDGWEAEFDCLRRCVAELRGYRRTFNNASVTNRGTREAPCPTLNLEKCEAGVCKGIAFEFPDDREEKVRAYLGEREGKAFPLERLTVLLEENAEVQAYVSVYGGTNLVSATTEQKAVMVGKAVGTKGSCRDYVKEIADVLAKLKIDDPAVSELWQAVRKQSFDSMIEEIRGRVKLLETSLPRRVDAMAVSRTSKLPFKVLLYREALIWKMEELSRNALENLERSQLAIAIIVTRAAVETSAALWYLWTKLDSVGQTGVVGEVDDDLMKLLMGSRTDPELPQAINVMTFVNRLDRSIEGFRHQYDMLSEFAHPNWAGTALLYSKSDQVSRATEFGAGLRASDSVKEVGAVNLSVALMIFERYYNQIAEILPGFIEHCESRLKAEGGT